MPLIEISTSGIHITVANPTLNSILRTMLLTGVENLERYLMPILPLLALLAFGQHQRLVVGTSIDPEFYYRALIFRHTVLDRADKSTVLYHYNLGIIVKNRGRYNQAIEHFRDAKAILEYHALSGINNDKLSIIACTTQIAAVMGEQGNYDVAIQLFTKALDTVERIHGKDHIVTAHVLNNMATVLKNKGEFDEALKYYRRALFIFQMWKNRKESAIVKTNLSLVLTRMGDLEEALTFSRRALVLKINCDDFGPHHPSTAISYNNQGLILHQTSQYDEALSCHQLALDIRKNALGTDHLATAQSYNNIADVLEGLEKREEAMAYCTKALNIRQIFLGENHALVKGSQKQMASLEELCKQ